MSACQGRKDSGGSDDKVESNAKAESSAKAESNAKSPSSSGSATGGDGRRAPEPEDPFAEEIAENLASVPDPTVVAAGAGSAADLDNQTFRDRVVAFVRQVSAGGKEVTCDLALTSKRPFRAVVWLYRQGEVTGRGQASGAALCTALKDATRRAIAATGASAGSEAIAGARFRVDLPNHDYSLVEFEGEGVELSHGAVPVRVLDKELLRERIEQGKAYLLRVINPERKGVHKYYRATVDSFEHRVHTIYTASTIFTLLKLYAYDRDEELREHIDEATEFLLSMQSRNPRERSYGGFYYSFDLHRERPKPKLVVGTTSKTIFTLLELHALTEDNKYLDAASMGANWLMSMQRPNGSVRSYLRQKSGGTWVVSKKESLLYTGQVLSALSRIYKATQNPRYLDAASRTANYLAGKVSAQGCYLGDDYRKPNPISSSWVILSLFDFVKVTEDPTFRQIVFRCADELLGRQLRNAEDVYRYGRWRRSLSSSGNGWLAEVMSELYLYCQETGMDSCERFEDAIIRVIRLLMQYTYTPESAFVVKNPDRAVGGVFWNVQERYVRTDSVCHAMNAYINMFSHLDDGPLIEVPEPPLSERLMLTGAPAAKAEPGGDGAGGPSVENSGGASAAAE